MRHRSLPSHRRRVPPPARALVIAGALALMCTGTASAKVNLLSGPLTPELAGQPGEFRSEVKMRKGVPVLVNFISLDYPDYNCTGDGDPFLLQVLGINFPAAKVKKQDGKYVFSSAAGPTDSMSGTVSKNGLRLRGQAHLETTVDERPGYVCRASPEFNAKSIYL